MKILFDQGTPVPLRRSLPEHFVATAYELGWQTLENGSLIAAAEADGFEVMITTDQISNTSKTYKTESFR